MNIGALLQRCAQHWPDRPAVVDARDGKVLTFARFTSHVFALGRMLRSTGLQEQDRVAILGDNTPSYLLWDYGSMSAGLVRVPLDPGLSADEQAAQLNDAQARMLAYGSEYAERAHDLAARVLGLALRPLDAAVTPAETGPAAAPAPAALASLNYTGGSTGAPKAVMITHGSITSALQNIVLARQHGPGDIMLNMRPLWPIAAIIVLAQLAAGGTVVLAGRFHPQRFLELLSAHRATSTSLVPTHLVRLLKETRPADHDLSSLRTIDVGAAAIPPDTFLAAIDGFGPRLGILYGLTEASWSCYQPPCALADPAVRAQAIRTVGRPVFGCEIRIEREGQAVPAGEEGEVLIRGNHVAAGYWRQPELSAQVFREGWFHTGDLGALDDSGVLRITGRLKEVIRSGGKSILPDEVERALCSHPAVADAAAAGLPDPEWGEIVAAAVVLHEGAAATAEELMEHCRLTLSGFKKPRIVRFVPAIPKSHYGKVQRAKVRALLADGA
ncbi:MAG: AMP-binding protein [Pigmentiphaga sp.]|uniref:class I adenylate-forming enzyme family protein n=1 Tax=Pigmentiphaga sp. TaxID=1977564 RepID=UPI0029AD7D2C|nr:AMP-binding protein [Pigmentiphaga sp.]MDX3904627.1 AMP-binding protein [Pigmentiphaga sp.]